MARTRYADEGWQIAKDCPFQGDVLPLTSREKYSSYRQGCSQEIGQGGGAYTAKHLHVKNIQNSTDPSFTINL